MNIEEAIDILAPKENIDLSNHFNNTRFFEAIYTLLTAYEKQSKEIEELKAINKMQEYRINEMDIPKSVAEQKERKAYIKGTNDADELCNKKWEDKIKAKTIEIKNRPAKDEFITASQGKLNTIIDMESLL